MEVPFRPFETLPRGRARPPDADRPTPRRGLHLPEHPPGVLRRSAPARRLARRPPARRPGPRRLPRRVPRPGPGAPASASTVVAAACFRARLTHEPSPAGERTARVLAGYRRTAGARGRVPTRGFVAADLGRRPRHLPPAAASSPTRSPSARPPRRRDRGVPLHGRDAEERGERPPLVRHRRRGRRRRGAGHRRDRSSSPVRRSKTNQEGETRDVRFVKDGVARALRMLRAAASPALEDQVVALLP